MFDALDSQLAGITEHNLAEVESCLRQMGVAYVLPRVPYGLSAPLPPPTPTPVQPD